MSVRKKLAKYLTVAAVLPAPVANQSLETLERRVVAVGASPSGLVIAPERDHFVITTGFAPENRTRESVFGRMVDNKRVFVGDKTERFDWRGFFPLPGDSKESGSRVLAFEGSRLAFFELDAGTLTEIVRRSLPWDQIKPPRDRGGEPTTAETAGFRAGFKKAMRSVSGTKVSGIAQLPDGWLKNDKTNYLLLSRLQNFPLLLVECSKATPSQCMVTRGCSVEGYKGSAISKLAGIGVRPDSREVVLGDPESRQLHVLTFNSCYNVVFRESRALPDRIKTLTNITVDKDGRLFVTTDMPDDYLNASLYYWNKDQW
jgi:hypothetical protein